MRRAHALVLSAGLVWAAACSGGPLHPQDEGAHVSVGSLDATPLAPDVAAPVDVAADVPPEARAEDAAGPDVAADASAIESAVADAPGTDRASPTDGGLSDATELLCPSYGGLTRGELAAGTAASGACATPDDLDWVCTGNVRALAGACSLSCVGMATLQSCTEACLGVQTQLTQGCRSCYAAAALCTLTVCLTDCVTDPAAARCVQCQLDKGCTSAFRQCSGLPALPARDAGG
jgi:hypothetical protein